jgi:hypothetical protein
MDEATIFMTFEPSLCIALVVGIASRTRSISPSKINSNADFPLNEIQLTIIHPAAFCRAPIQSSSAAEIDVNCLSNCMKAMSDALSSLS